MIRNKTIRYALVMLFLVVSLSACDEPDDVVSAVLFDNQPEVFRNLEVTLNLVNGWNLEEGDLYGIDVFFRNQNESTIDVINYSIAAVSPSSQILSFSSQVRSISDLRPRQNRRTDQAFFFFLDSPQEIYVGNLYVILDRDTDPDTGISVLLNVSLQYEGQEYEETISLSFRTLESLQNISSSQCGQNITVTHSSNDGFSPTTENITYGTISHDNLCWIDRNLGATSRPTSATSTLASSRGWFWTFNRRQGYQFVTTLSPPNFPTTNPPAGDWSSQNDPCTHLIGQGWRIPTESEWRSFSDSWTSPNLNGAFSSPLRLHAGGYLTSGSLVASGGIGVYWSSTQTPGDTNSGRIMLFDGGGSDSSVSGSKQLGLPIRCVQ